MRPHLLTFSNERGQKASWWTWAKPAEQRAADHWRVCVSASIHLRVSRNKVGGLLCDIWTGAAPHHHLDLVHVQVLEEEDQNMEQVRLAWWTQCFVRCLNTTSVHEIHDTRDILLDNLNSNWIF